MKSGSNLRETRKAAFYDLKGGYHIPSNMCVRIEIYYSKHL